ncbi:MAG: 50S ribosomal protein L21 [Candidatus Dormibacteraeota bacterium]|nr:50S ribosomal protein L21 [Candidatus Dormibacteraeota bacterium]
MYAILSHGGRQYRVSAGDRLIVDRLAAEVGSVIALEPVLMTGGDGATAVGEGVVGLRIAATVVGHRRGPKLRIFKYKPKKRYRRAAGYRSDLTEVRIESILGKGEELPSSAPSSTRKTAGGVATVDAAGDETPAAKAPVTRARAKAASAKPVPARTATPAVRAKRASRPKPAAEPADTEESSDGA